MSGAVPDSVLAFGRAQQLTMMDETCDIYATETTLDALGEMTQAPSPVAQLGVPCRRSAVKRLGNVETIVADRLAGKIPYYFDLPYGTVASSNSVLVSGGFTYEVLKVSHGSYATSTRLLTMETS